MNIYYATIEENEVAKRHQTPKFQVEPVQIYGDKPLGKKPEYCCNALENLLYRNHFWGYSSANSLEDLRIILAPPSPTERINYCPFCGEKIRFVPHLHLRLVERLYTPPPLVPLPKFEIVAEE